LPVKITQFYAAASSVAKGDPGRLCYGVEDAVSVRIEPPVEQLSPSPTRCFDIKLSTTTTYKLIAEGRDGSKDERSATIAVTGAKPQFVDVSISAEQVSPGQVVSFCFKARNATSVSGGPGKFQHGGNPEGDCILDSPRQNTTYKLTISGGGGSDSRSITVRVR